MNNCYEMFRDELVERMTIEYSVDEIKKFLKYIDESFLKYSLELKETDIINYDDSFDSIIKIYLANKLLEGKSSGTVKVYKGVLKRLREYTGKQVNEIDSNDIRYFLFRVKRDRGIKDMTLDNYRIITSDFFRWIHNEGYIQKNPANNIDRIKYQKVTRNPITIMELEKLRDACVTYKEKAIFETLYSTGCRVAELSGIKISDIDFENSVITVLGKGKKYRKVFLNARSIIAIKNYLENLPYKSEYLFANDRKPHNKMYNWSIEKTISRISSRTDIEKKVTPHILRHTMATIALSNGMKIEEISKILGHAKISTTMVYAKSNINDIKNKHSKCIL